MYFLLRYFRIVHARFGNDGAVWRSCCCSPRSLQYEGFQLISSSRDITLRGTPPSVHMRALIHVHFCGSYKQGKHYYDKAQIHHCLYYDFFLKKYRKLAGFAGQWTSFSFWNMEALPFSVQRKLQRKLLLLLYLIWQRKRFTQISKLLFLVQTQFSKSICSFQILHWTLGFWLIVPTQISDNKWWETFFYRLLLLYINIFHVSVL